MTTLTTKCWQCGTVIGAPAHDAEIERLKAALAECEARALRTMSAQQAEIERLRAALKQETAAQ